MALRRVLLAATAAESARNATIANEEIEREGRKEERGMKLEG